MSFKPSRIPEADLKLILASQFVAGQFAQTGNILMSEQEIDQAWSVAGKMIQRWRAEQAAARAAGVNDDHDGD